MSAITSKSIMIGINERKDDFKISKYYRPKTLKLKNKGTRRKYSNTITLAWEAFLPSQQYRHYSYIFRVKSYDSRIVWQNSDNFVVGVEENSRGAFLTTYSIH